MQGGRSDNSVLGSWGGKFDVRASSEGESSGYESEVEITSRISLGYTFDAVLHSLRTFFAVSISLPVAWMCLHPTIGSFRARKFRMVDKGTKTVVWVQKKLRSRLGDYYFGFFFVLRRRRVLPAFVAVSYLECRPHLRATGDINCLYWFSFRKHDEGCFWFTSSAISAGLASRPSRGD
mmetsp:Transcript_18121/g.30866  ORF Transcript_18121/g.30866 Transcript_18121/m.30866 type:complete len:178 (+) Transcript_18121:110-643(+)